jgi:hypothetical protein
MTLSQGARAEQILPAGSKGNFSAGFFLKLSGRRDHYSEVCAAISRYHRLAGNFNRHESAEVSKPNPHAM